MITRTSAESLLDIEVEIPLTGSNASPEPNRWRAVAAHAHLDQCVRMKTYILGRAFGFRELWQDARSMGRTATEFCLNL